MVEKEVSAVSQRYFLCRNGASQFTASFKNINQKLVA